MTEQWLRTVSPSRDCAASRGTRPVSTQRLNDLMGPATIIIRTLEQVEGFFGGLEPFEPGVVQPQHRRPGPGGPAIRTGVPTYREVVRKN